jgi:hypothetical protein
MTKAALWIVRSLAVAFNVIMAAVLWIGFQNLWAAGFTRQSNIPLVLRALLVILTFLGPVLNLVAIFWKPNDRA